MDQAQIIRLIENQRAFFRTGKTKDIAFRKAQLKRLLALIKANDAQIVKALHDDMRKPPLEAYAGEIAVVKNETRQAIRHVMRWTRRAWVMTPPPLFPALSYLTPEPLGVVLIVSPWNYPFHLALAPLVGAMAAGNCTVLKPSEYAPFTSQLMAELISQAFDPGYLAVVEGDVQAAKILLEEKFDYIFFTGGTATGRIVMEAASRHLTPVTLELGGKSPCIVDADIRLDYAAKRVAWAKFFNAGQTCVAPDYLLVDRGIKPVFLERLKKWVQRFYGDDPSRSPDYARIINARHFQRLANLLGAGEIVIGGQMNAEERYIAPTIIDRVSPDHPVMQEEIFGPILPVLAYDDLAEVIAFVNARPKPLALYFFCRDQRKQERIVAETSSGGVCLNDAMVHVASHTLPFGGVGDSGMGAYHGKTSFDTFTHWKGVVHNTLAFDIPLRYIPYRYKLPLVRWFF